MKALEDTKAFPEVKRDARGMHRNNQATNTFEEHRNHLFLYDDPNPDMECASSFSTDRYCGRMFVRKVIGEGSFYCPVCQGLQNYKHKNIRLKCHWCWILNCGGKKIGEYTKCENCKNHFYTDVLQWNQTREEERRAALQEQAPSSTASNSHSPHDCMVDIEDGKPENSVSEKESGPIPCGKVIVQRAGLPVINGVYVLYGTYNEGAGMYVKEGMWKEHKEVLALYRCHVADCERRWYISIASKHAQLGTNDDIDFYSAPVIDDQITTPPEDGWKSEAEGLDPPPIVFHKAVEKGIPAWEQKEGGSWHHGLK